VLARLQQFLLKLKFDPQRASLSVWLALTNVVIVVLVLAGISISAISMLRTLADNQGQARVQLAGALAREDLRRYGEDTLKQARGLAALPTLQRLVTEQRAESVEQVLKRACEADGLSSCAVFNGSVLVAQSGAPLPWAEVLLASDEQGERFMAAPTGGGPAMLGSTAPLNGSADLRLLAIRLFDADLATRISERVGLPVRLLNYRNFTGAPVDDFTQLHSAGLSDGRFAVQRIDAFDLYASSFPVFATTGEAVALIEARLSAADIDSSVSRLIKQLLVTALILAALAVLAGYILGQRVAGPVSDLTQAATRLGEGDFSASIPTGGTAEVGVLARTMEDMRRNLVELTGALRRREAEAQAVLKGVVEGVYAVDKSRVITYLNPQAARMLGVEPKEAIGRFCGDVLKPCVAENGQPPCETHCPILLARSEGSAQAVERLDLGQGAPRTAVIVSAASVDGLQVQVIRDETDLEAVRRARDSTLANISHEFRTPLAAQLASIELLREGLNTMQPHDREELVLSLERGTLRLTRLIDNLLESVRIEAGQLGIRRQSVALAEIVEDAQALIGSLLVQRRQTLEVDLPRDLPNIDGDGSRLTQVFVNLLANSIKYAPEGSTIRIGAEVRGDRVAAWVEDEGPGLPHVDSGSIFDQFHRGAQAEPEPGGLGLGLWIVKSIIERHGGQIIAARTPENRTRFVITLPVEAG
jgi:signal transduction histidine kinase